MAVIYKIVSSGLWKDAVARGELLGAPVDLADGYIHFSDVSTVAETAAKHFAGMDDLLLLAIDAAVLGPELKWEVSRGGKLFPHLYRPLAVSEVREVTELTLGPDGMHLFPAFDAP